MTYRNVSSLVGLTVFLAACGGGSGGAGEKAETTAAAPAPATAPATEVALGARVQFDGLSFAPPARWESVAPTSAMRKAEYRVPGAGDAGDGECALFFFPGTGGTVEANLQRWYGQMSQPDGGSTADLAHVETFSSGGMNVTFVDVSGTYSGGMSGNGPFPDYRLLGGIVESGGAPWFLKCTGPEATMAGAVDELKALLKSVGP